MTAAIPLTPPLHTDLNDTLLVARHHSRHRRLRIIYY